MEKPSHNRYLLSSCDQEQYRRIFKKYQDAKKYGIRAVLGYVTGAELYQIIGEVARGIIITWGRRKAAALATVGMTWVGGPVVMCFTNATKAVKVAKGIHGAASFTLEVLDDTSNLTMLPLDLLLFGKPVPMGAPNRFNILSNCTDFLNETFD
jgi:hypothetical protein